MLDNIYKDAIREFETYFPNIAKEAIGYLPQGRTEILFITKNKDHYIYDMRIRGIRKLKPISDEGLSEDEWRTKFSMMLNFKMMGMGFTQRDLAEATGIAYHSICNYVNGKSIPNGYYIEKIAEALGCSSAELMRFQ